MKYLPYNKNLKDLAKKKRQELTPSETRMWKRLSRQQCWQYDFHRQKPILDYIVDFFCPEAMLAIEIDGVSHNWDGEREWRREEEIKALGVWFLRYPDHLAYTNPDAVFNSIGMALEDWEEKNGTPDVVRTRRLKLKG